MRTIHTLPLAAAIMLAACGGGDADADGDGKVSADEVAAEASGMVKPLPGQYSASLELLEFDAPNMPPEAKAQMQQVFSSGLAQANKFCMTEAEANQNGPEQMVKNLAEGDCTMNSFNVSGNTIVAEMQCPGQTGGTSKVRMEGEMRPDGSTMTMDMEQDIAGMGATRMKMRVTSKRLGDCPAA
jgi:hypothetical protein